MPEDWHASPFLQKLNNDDSSLEDGNTGYAKPKWWELIENNLRLSLAYYTSFLWSTEEKKIWPHQAFLCAKNPKNFKPMKIPKLPFILNFDSNNKTK